MILLATAADIDATLRDSISLIVPEAALVGTACILFILATCRANRHVAGMIALAGLGLAAVLLGTVSRPGDLLPTVAPVVADHLALFVRVMAIVSGAVLVLVGWNEPGDRRACEYHACLLCIVAGLSLVGAANDLIFLFLALELISIPTYVMLYLPKSNDANGQEATLKYFMLSILSSAMLLFGFSYLYGATGTTNISAILKILPTAAAGDMATLVLIAVVMIVAGLGFSHHGVPVPLLCAGRLPDRAARRRLDARVCPQGGRFCRIAAAIRRSGGASRGRLFVHQTVPDFLVDPGGGDDDGRQRHGAAAEQFSAAARLFRRRARRLHVDRSGGAIFDFDFGGRQDAVHYRRRRRALYLVAYGTMTVGAFAVVAYLNRPDRGIDAIDDLAGLHETNPLMAFAMAIYLFSMIGLPMTAGFAGKFYLFLGALSRPATEPMSRLYQALALIGAVNAAVAAYYYLRVVGVIYLRGSFQPRIATCWSPILIAIVVCAFATLLLGIYPNPLLHASQWAFTVK